MGYDYLDEPFPEWIAGDTQQRFTQIYRRRFWGRTGSVSGPGSNPEQTRELIRQLPRLFRHLGVRTLLDLPCGDFNWMRQVDLAGIGYFGADIVEELVERNQRLYGAADRRFLHLDMTVDELPRSDLICCRDGLVHLPLPLGLAAVENFRRSAARWLLATSFPSCRENREVQTGDWRSLNLECAPFDLGQPAFELLEQCPEEGYEDKILGLWRLGSRP